MALILTNLKSTQETAFGVGDATLDASGLSTARSFALPDASGTLALQGAITTSGLTIASGRLAGRTTGGTGALEEISVGSGLTFASGSLSADVTSVAGRTGAVTLTDADISGLGTLATLNSIDLTTDVTGILPSANGGTGNGFAKFSGPASSEKTFTLPDASATILTTDAVVAVVEGGTGAANAADARTNLGAAAAGGIDASGLTISSARLAGRATASVGAIEEITVGTGLTLSGGVLQATGGGAVSNALMYYFSSF